MPALATHHRVYALDLIGFGRSAKPAPGLEIDYCFETWAEQILTFCQEVVGSPAVLVGNSIGCIAALQATVQNPAMVRGVIMINCSLRMLHERKRAALPWVQRTFSPWFQKVLALRPIGHFFFHRLARAKTIRQILNQAYVRKAAITDELVQLLLQPALEPGAADVFLAFIQYSHGPLAEELLPQVHCPVLCLWGDEDPWEPIQLGRAFAKYEAVTDFIALENTGHCPQDEAPELVNPILGEWVAQHCPS